MYYRLRALKCVLYLGRWLLDNTPFLLSKEFGFDIPHQKTNMSLDYSKKKNRPMFNQYVAFSALSRKWIKEYLCFILLVYLIYSIPVKQCSERHSDSKVIIVFPFFQSSIWWSRALPVCVLYIPTRLPSEEVCSFITWLEPVLLSEIDRVGKDKLINTQLNAFRNSSNQLHIRCVTARGYSRIGDQ